MKNENKPKTYSFDALAPEFLNGITPLALKLYENVCTFRMISDKTPQEELSPWWSPSCWSLPLTGGRKSNMTARHS